MSRSARPSTSRVARISYAISIHKLLAAAKNQIPLSDKFIQPEYIPKYLEDIRKQIRARRWHVAQVDSAIVGAMLLQGDDVFYLVVSPIHKRCGVGKALMTYAKWRWSKLTTKTRGDNFPMITFLQKEGFELDPIMHVQEGWDGYHWERRLKAEK